MIRGAFAAALTPLRDGGSALDEEAFGPYLVSIRELLFSRTQVNHMRERLRALGLIEKDDKVLSSVAAP